MRGQIEILLKEFRAFYGALSVKELALNPCVTREIQLIENLLAEALNATP